MLKPFKKNIQKKLSSFEKENNVYIIPNKNGFKYIFLNFGLFLIALTYSNNMSLFICFLMFAYLIYEMLRTHQQIAQIQGRTVYIKHGAHQNEHHPLDIQIVNPTQGLSKDDIEVSLKLGKQTILKTICHNIGNNILNFSLRDGKRNHYKIDRLRINNKNQNNLFYVWKHINYQTDFYIYPKKEESPLNSSSHLNQKDQLNLEYKTKKPYEDGTPAKRIDWKHYAKTDELYSKVYESESPDGIHFDYSNFHTDKESILSQLAYLISKAQSENKTWKLTLPSTSIGPAKGKNHLQECMEALSEF